MPRRKKIRVQTHVLEESLSDVIYGTIEVELPKVETHADPKTQHVEQPEVKVETRGSARFYRLSTVLSDVIYMVLEVKGFPRKVSKYCYLVEDLQTAYNLKCKVDTVVEYRKTSDPYQLDVDEKRLRSIDKRLKSDFISFTSELGDVGMRFTTPITVERVVRSMQSGATCTLELKNPLS